MKTLRLANFGIRGFIGGSLTPEVVIDFASAFATFLDGGRVLVGRDTRQSSPMMNQAALAGLLSGGCEVVDFGICPAPMLQFSVKAYEAAGALSISGGHNGMGWNAVTLIGKDGAVLDPMGGENVLDFYHSGDFIRSGWESVGSVESGTNFSDAYFNALTEFLDCEKIREAGFTVLVDPVGGAGCAFLEPFARHLGLRLVPINGEASGYLARDPEPRPRTAQHLASIIKHLEGDVGFALSSDMGRLSIVSEVGEPASEEYTFPLIANHILAKTPGPLVTNCCTTRTIDDVAATHHIPIMKTPVGQAYVVSTMSDEDGILGGEGNGSVALAHFSRAFDGFLMMGVILESMAQSGEPVSRLLQDLPRYHIIKRTRHCGSRETYAALDRLKTAMLEYEDSGQIDLTDGIRVDWHDGWIHARASRTEQMIRIISESENPELAQQRQDEVGRILNVD